MFRTTIRVSATVLAVVLLCASGGVAEASGPGPVALEERGKGAARVIVGRTLAIETRIDRNDFGDELIFSRVLVQVEETLKGDDAAFAWIDVEGGSHADLTLRVSDLPEMQPDERAVYFLGRARNGVHTPHLRGQGILKLDDQGLVRGTSLRVDEIRRVVQSAR
jgi:hypothetical protein